VWAGNVFPLPIPIPPTTVQAFPNRKTRWQLGDFSWRLGPVIKRFCLRESWATLTAHFSVSLMALGHGYLWQPEPGKLSTNSPFFSKLEACGLRLFVLSDEQFQRCHWNCWEKMMLIITSEEWQWQCWDSVRIHFQNQTQTQVQFQFHIPYPFPGLSCPVFSAPKSIRLSPFVSLFVVSGCGSIRQRR